MNRAVRDPPLQHNHSLSIEWNSIRLGGPAHGIVIKTVHKTLPGGGGGPWGGWVGVVGVQGVGGYLVVGSSGWVGTGVVGVQGWMGRENR